MLGSISCLVAPSSHALESIAPYFLGDMSVARNRPHHASSQRILQIACPSPTSNSVDFQAFLLSGTLGCIPKNLGTEEGRGTIPPLYSRVTTCRLLTNRAIQAVLLEIYRNGTGYMCKPSDVHRKLTQNR